MMAMSRVLSVLVMVVLLVAVPLAHAQPSDADYEEFLQAKAVAQAPAPPSDGVVATESTPPPPPSCSRYVAKSGAQYTTVKSAVSSVPDGMTERCVIYVAEGVYEENFQIESTKGPITLQGVSAITTVIQYGLYAEVAGSTAKSCTVCVDSDKFIAQDITIANTHPPPAGGAVGQQAVAFLIEGDEAEFYRVAFLGGQDTLYDKAGRHYYKNCYIQGSIDFIFGAGDAYFDGCVLNSIAAPYSGSLTAQKKTTENQISGFVFNGCVVTGSGPIYLGRAWGIYSKVIFAYTNITAPIIPAGWFNWGDPTREKTVYYAQYKCYGPGANTTGRVNWSKDLSDSQAAPFLTWDYIDGSQWIGKN